MSWHAGNTIFSQKISNITSQMFMKSVHNDSKMGPKVVPERSTRHFQRNAANTFRKLFKRLQKSTKPLPEMILKSQKTVWVALFLHQKNDVNLEIVFSRFFAPSGGPRPLSSSQNAIIVCKNEGPSFSREAALFYNN